MAYPENIRELAYRTANFGPLPNADAAGADANLSCGSFIRFELRVNEANVEAIGVTSTGCGYMAAAAVLIADHFTGKPLADLHGLSDAELESLVWGGLGEVPPDRLECVSACRSALRAAFADLRRHRIDEYAGDMALICTCFGVSENTVEGVIAGLVSPDLAAVAEACNAGGGCGSCRMLIQELIDVHLSRHVRR